MRISILWSFFGALVATATSPASAWCDGYGAAETVGALDTTLVNEASGLVVSKDYADRLYHINDSGDGPNVYVSKRDGSAVTKFAINGFAPIDVEDLAYGACPNIDGKCLFVADVGDNKLARPSVSIQIIKEQEAYGETVDAVKVLTIKYPDGAHDLESVAVHPNGDLFLLSKEADYANHTERPAVLFKVAHETWAGAVGEIVAERVGEIDLPWAAYEYGLWGRIATSMDISPDGKSFVVLTYQTAVEFNFDLSAGALPATRSLVEERDYRVIKIPELVQAEAIAYLPDGSGILYDTEFNEGDPAPIMEVACRSDTPN